MLPHQRHMRFDLDGVDLGDLNRSLSFVFVNWRDHYSPNVQLFTVNGPLEMILTWDPTTETPSIEEDLENLINFARQYKIKLQRKAP